MSSFKIHGGKVLSGSIAVSGSKNAILPIVCSALLVSGVCVIKNVPEISDVKNLIAILRGLGAVVDDSKPGTLAIDSSAVNSYLPDPNLVKKMRGSVLLLGPLLARFKMVEMPFPGGDLIGPRPIGVHLAALEALGAKIESQTSVQQSQTPILRISAEGGLSGADITLHELSVTATENVIMAAVTASGQTHIHLAAAEPHVQDLCWFLQSAGAKIQGIGTHDLIIDGVSELHSTEHSIIPDSDAVCSYLCLAAATKSNITVTGARADFIRSPLNKLREMNVNYKVGENSITIFPPEKAYVAPSIKLEGMIYPGVMSDQLPPFAVLATQAEGTTLIHEHMYEGRLGYIHELAKMGANARIIDQHRAEITGPTKLRGMNISSLDVRSGMVMVIAALVAEGQSILHDVEHVDRGYPDIDKILRDIGADISREEE
jgi:UDP-N-acetylglucosamine 1-carboxyvinyltransferase